MAAIAAAVALTACGAQRQDVSEPSGKFMVQTSATFPTTQRLSEHTRMVIKVRNVDSRPLPNVAVTICNVTCKFPAPPGEGSSAQAFSQYVNQPYAANQSRPVWVVDKPPGVCSYSCAQGAPGAAVTAYSNTWALGPLKPGATATFVWGVTAAKPGTHIVAWEVAAGLNGKATAAVPSGSTPCGAIPCGTFRVKISIAAPHPYVTDSGKIVNQR